MPPDTTLYFSSNQDLAKALLIARGFQAGLIANGRTEGFKAVGRPERDPAEMGVSYLFDDDLDHLGGALKTNGVEYW